MPPRMGQWPFRSLTALLVLGSALTVQIQATEGKKPKSAVSQPQSQDALLDILETEMKREMALLSKQTSAPYHITYRVDEVERFDIAANLGALNRKRSQKTRTFHVQVRVGDVNMDSTREIRDDMDWFSSSRNRASLPLENDPAAIATALWKETDAVWRKAVDRYAKVKANVAVKVKAEDTSADFSMPQKPSVYVEPMPLKLDVDLEAWGTRLRKISSTFTESPHLSEGGCSLYVNHTRRYLVSSDGTRVVQNFPSSRIMLMAETKAEDGMELPLFEDFYAFRPEKLPADGVILQTAQKMARTLEAMRQAPVVEPFSGPALMAGEASGVFFHEIFGHRIEGNRQKSDNDGQTFKKKLGEKVLPESLSVYCDPQKFDYDGQDLNGSYRFDDEGMAGSRVDVIKDGVLQSFLMSRCPIQGFAASNGHGRAEIGFDPVSRQSNLIIESKEKLDEKAIRDKFMEEIKRQQKPYGLYFRRVTGGFTMTGRFIPNAFNVTPTEVYRVYADGRADELVRGVDLVGTPLVIFSHVMAAGGQIETFTGTCGAESGGVPVSSVSPELLIRQIEVQKKNKSSDRPPILSRPMAVEGGAK